MQSTVLRSWFGVIQGAVITCLSEQVFITEPSLEPLELPLWCRDALQAICVDRNAFGIVIAESAFGEGALTSLRSKAKWPRTAHT